MEGKRVGIGRVEEGDNDYYGYDVDYVEDGDVDDDIGDDDVVDHVDDDGGRVLVEDRGGVRVRCYGETSRGE